jgi:hypothetical protein
MRISGKEVYICLMMALLIFVYACTDHQAQREKAEAVARKSIARIADSIAASITEVVMERTPPGISEGDTKTKALKSLDALSVSVQPEEVDSDKRPGLWRIAFRSDFKAGDTKITYFLLVSTRLGLISSVESIVLKDIAINGDILKLNKKVK